MPVYSAFVFAAKTAEMKANDVDPDCDQCRRGLYCADTDIDAQDIEGVCRLAPGEGERCGQGPVFEVCRRRCVRRRGMCIPQSPW